MARTHSSLAALVLVSCLAGLAVAAGPPELVVAARSPGEDTGTMHYAEQLSLRIGAARPLVLGQDGGGIFPIPGPHYRVGEARFVLVGWSSMGAGMQTLHALSLEVRDGAVVLAGELTQTTDRISSRWLVRSGSTGTFRLGIPEPPSDAVNDAEGWWLRATPGGGNGVDFTGLRELPFEDVTRQAGDRVYSPPFDRAASPARVAWVSIGAAGEFVLPRRAPAR